VDVRNQGRIPEWNWGSAALAIFALAAFSAPAFADCGYNRGDWKAGEKVYNETCIACHGANGKGAIPGAPDFTQKGGVLSRRPMTLMTEHIKNGFRAPGAMMAMPPKGGNPGLGDQDIMNVHAYLHHRFGCG
jgi:mono/diheme cytochrome c family protein